MTNPFLKEKANKVLDELLKIGLKESNATPWKGVSFAPINKIKKEKLPLLIRLIRRATLLERNGYLIADIDRLGKVTGWHLGRRE